MSNKFTLKTDKHERISFEEIRFEPKHESLDPMVGNLMVESFNPNGSTWIALPVYQNAEGEYYTYPTADKKKIMPNGTSKYVHLAGVNEQKLTYIFELLNAQLGDLLHGKTIHVSEEDEPDNEPAEVTEEKALLKRSRQ